MSNNETIREALKLLVHRLLNEGVSIASIEAWTAEADAVLAAAPPAPDPREALAARPLLEQVARMADRIGQHTVGEIAVISDRAAAWLAENPPGQPVAIEPRGCPTPGACSCVEPPAPAIGPEWRPCVKLPITVHVRDQHHHETHISTREGITPVRPDDLIMRGVQGEEYPIGRDLFNKTYRLGTADPTDSAPAPAPEAGAALSLAAIIRQVDGSNSLGAAALADAILSHPNAASVFQPPAPDPDPSDFQTFQGLALDMVESLRPIVIPEILGVLHKAIKSTPQPAPAPEGLFLVEYWHMDSGARIISEPSEERSGGCWVVRNSRHVSPFAEFPTVAAALAALQPPQGGEVAE